MILTVILNTLLQVILLITYPLTLLPNVILPTNFADALNSASGFFNSLNTILPIDTMLTILGVFLTIELAYFSYKGIMWVIKKIPFIN